MRTSYWVVVARYATVREAHAAASQLSERGIPCQLVVEEPSETLNILPADREWLSIEVLEEDFERAADLLSIPHFHADDFSRDGQTVGNWRAWVFGGVFVAVVLLLRLLADQF